MTFAEAVLEIRKTISKTYKCRHFEFTEGEWVITDNSEKSGGMFVLDELEDDEEFEGENCIDD